MIKLSRRLQRIADYVTEGARVADIGSDHALLPVYLLQIGKCPSAIAGELNAGPLQAAKKQAADAGLKSRISARQGNGLAVLEPGEADTVTIAGMGGSLMSAILEEGHASGKLVGVKELVLQPNVGEDEVREWLLEKGWFLAAESILEEDGKIYEVLHAVNDPNAASQNQSIYNGDFLGLAYEKELLHRVLLRMGPYLLRESSPVLTLKWKSEIKKLERIIAQMSGSELAESAAKAEQFRKEIGIIEEVLQCLQTGIR
ncbi:class I SAM-dependent methyltransferase [Paenibacillus sp. LHD-117]|uniref:tRNA (adenine(22)-N(1))-methyltransferase n=1 Tax=Paenibacillus sp. LHD-117 TaxID=3071412 RepID=UPI0027E0265B|nr:class I SAM-dependent methyltransferase [Paenibacillus sp. LHD-117]MDQ6421101.1 class I SAM-dependent methyltransferase [Paenibacillus sp. LHD-117]